VDRVLIVCGAGASSTFLALRVRRVARSRGLDLIVEAGTLADLDERLAATRILLVGPHLSAQFDDVNERARARGVEAALLPDTAFGAEGADAATDLVTELLATSGRAENLLKAEPTQGD